MKTLFILTIAFCSFGIGLSQSSSTKSCELVLQTGIYQLMEKPIARNWAMDFKNYLLSPKFKRDLQIGLWGKEIVVKLSSKEVKLSYRSSTEEYDRFIQEINSGTLLNTTEHIISLVSNIPNSELITSYNSCKSNTTKGLTQGVKVETLESVMFVFYYEKQSANENPPRIKSMEIRPEDIMPELFGATINSPINSSVFTILCKRDKSRDVNLTLNTSAAKMTGHSNSSRGSGLETPVGTIISSYLNFSTFKESVGQGPNWKSTDKWAPCDGRFIGGSVLSLSGIPQSPDLRGYFLRGRNEMDPVGSSLPLPPFKASERNPDEPAFGLVQQDTIQSHLHGFKSPNLGTYFGGINDDGDFGMYHGSLGQSETTSPTGYIETRPKNLSVYYYIKIN